MSEPAKSWKHMTYDERELLAYGLLWAGAIACLLIRIVWLTVEFITTGRVS